MDKADINNLYDIYITNDNNLNSSWFDIVEEELGNSIDNKALTGSMNNSKSSEHIILENIQENIQAKLTKNNIDNLILIKCNELQDLEILESEMLVTYYVKNVIKNINLSDMSNMSDISDIINKLNWLLQACEYLSKKIGLNNVKPKKSGNEANKIFRSSYKFCDYNYKCEFNYDRTKHGGCYAQHYVHNIIYYDIEALRNFFLDTNDYTQKDVKEEIKKSINTIFFVINHMYDELKNSDKHINRAPSKKRRKRQK